MSKEISNSDDIIDSRDVIARVDELQGRVDTAREVGEDWDGMDDDERAGRSREQYVAEQADPLDDDETEELRVLKALADDGENSAGDWQHGATLIRDSYFEDYAQELAEDLGYIKRDVSWPYTCIDWEKAARELRMDYSSVEFDGETYWVRS